MWCEHLCNCKATEASPWLYHGDTAKTTWAEVGHGPGQNKLRNLACTGDYRPRRPKKDLQKTCFRHSSWTNQGKRREVAPEKPDKLWHCPARRWSDELKRRRLFQALREPLHVRSILLSLATTTARLLTWRLAGCCFPREAHAAILSKRAAEPAD